MRQPICVHCEGVWTGNPKQPQAQCLRAADQLITSVDTIGDRPSASASARPSDDYLHIDARGLFAVPAFIDAHLHMLMGGDSLTRLDLSRVTSRSEFERAIMDRAAELPQGTWLEAHGWDESTWGGAIPTSDWLRRAGDRPCICWRMDRHAALVNQTVLDRIDNAVDPPGGRFARDQQGRATGIAYEGAAWHLINPLIPAPTRLQKQQALVAAERHLLDLGVASVGSMEYGADAEEIIADAARCSRVRIALTLLDRALPLDFSTGQRLRAMTGPGIIPDPLSVVGYKSFVDGTLGSRTARMLESYSDDACNCGLFLEHALDGTLAQWMQSVLSAGFSPSVHAIGDAALRAALDAA
ncbi:MAG: hypothetical protein EXS00_07085, partial [Phycisphaerales bacterium]|nr:hypothetical protein [Phycisphaerales bacterium]